MEEELREEKWTKIKNTLSQNDLDAQLAWTDNDDVNGHAKIIDHGHTGKGPKGWQRSDERIKEDVSASLYRDSEIDASGIEVSVQDGVVLLSGEVDSRSSKRAAERCVEELPGVQDVQNQLKLRTS